MASNEKARIEQLNQRAVFFGRPDTEKLTIYDVKGLLAFYDRKCLDPQCPTPDKPATSPDHVIPLDEGGTNTVENLQLLHTNCNKRKGNKRGDYRNGKILTAEYCKQFYPEQSANTPKTDEKRKAPKTAWKPGQSGNPNGRPSAGMSWAELIKAEGAKYNEEMGITRKEYLVMCAFDHAEQGNASILKEIFQRSEPVADLVDLEVNDKREIPPDERSQRLATLLERARARRSDLVA